MRAGSIQFAALWDGPALEPWQQRCLEQLQAEADVVAKALIGNLGGGQEGDSRAASGNGGAAGGGGGPLEPSSAELAPLRGQALDFILTFSSRRCSPDLLAMARYGVWAFHFGDWIRGRDGPVGFWEVYDDEPISSAMLVRLEPNANSIVVLREGHVRTKRHSIGDNRRQLLERFTHWPAQVSRDIRAGITDRFEGKPLSSSSPARPSPGGAQHLICRLRLLTRAARTALDSLFSHEQWNVGVVNQPIATFLQHGGQTPIQWLPSPRRSEFRADPFGVMRDGKLTILYEHFHYGTNRGFIAAFTPGKDTEHIPVEIGPQPPVHLSYPLLLELNGRLFCLPESHEASEVALYEVVRFPDRWIKSSVLAAPIQIVDATLFQHHGRWWLMASEPAQKGDTSELHLWYSPSAQGPWQAHPDNPVKIDVRSARPGGTPFYADGVLYRPAQDCSRVYGGRIVINRVTALTPTQFREEPAATVDPVRSGPYPAGLHTLSAVGDVTLLDAKRMVFVPEAFRRVLGHFIQLALRRIGVRSP